MEPMGESGVTLSGVYSFRQVQRAEYEARVGFRLSHHIKENVVAKATKRLVETLSWVVRAMTGARVRVRGKRKRMRSIGGIGEDNPDFPGECSLSLWLGYNHSPSSPPASAAGLANSFTLRNIEWRRKNTFVSALRLVNMSVKGFFCHPYCSFCNFHFGDWLVALQTGSTHIKFSISDAKLLTSWFDIATLN